MRGADITRESWQRFADGELSWPQALAARMVKLHHHFDEIEHCNGRVRVAGLDYQLWQGPGGPLSAVIGDEATIDVPFTMWELGPLPAAKRSVAVLQLELASDSYDVQIGDGHEFNAYGDAFLLDIIEFQDLPSYSGQDVSEYRKIIRGFRSARTHLVPAVFEWLLVCPGDEQLPWKTTPLSPNFSPQVIPEDCIETTQWFVAEYPRAENFNIRGKLSNAFAAQVEQAPIAVGCG
jgi:hypothetical protein